MSDEDMNTVQSTGQKGYTTDPDGDLSSGRLAKLVALWASVGSAGSGFLVSSIALFMGKMDAGTFVGLVLGLVGAFIGVVLGNEITQKLTGR